MSDLVNITIEDRDGSQQPIEVPGDIALNLMEVLKASGYNILATCGGMALCATCHVQVLEGLDKLPAATDDEMDMLDTLHDADYDSRLACQIKVTDTLDGMSFKIRGDEH
jgi:ferredoxin